MSNEYDNCLAELRRRDLLPESRVAVFVSGSLVREWGNEKSDLDLFVICGEPWVSGSASAAHVALQPDVILTELTYVGKRRWDVKYWLDAQVDQLAHKVSWAQFDANPSAAALVTWREMDFLERLDYGVALDGSDWLERRRQELDESALRSIVVARHLKLVEVLLEDASGQVAAGDVESAVLSARQAFGHAVDALLASHGQLGQRDKWRARRFRQCKQDTISFDDYWAFETMRSLDPAAPARWVERVVFVCRQLMLDIDL